jgi:hypothetical protein
MPDVPPAQPNYSEVRKAEDQKKYANEQLRLRKKEEEDRRKAHVADSRGRAAGTGQSR